MYPPWYFSPVAQVTTEGHLACLPNQRPAFVPYGLDPVGDCSKQDLLVYKTDTHAVRAEAATRQNL
jgi:hypothetical protein